MNLKILGIALVCLIVGSVASVGAGYILVYNPKVNTLQNQISQDSAQIDNLGNKLNQLNSSFTQLTGSYNTLSTTYKNLQTNYTNKQTEINILNNKYNNLQTSYGSLQTQLTSTTSSYNEEKSLRIGTTLETYFDYVRASIAPLGEERWYLYSNYDTMSVEFAANEAAHDADQLYWPTLEKDTRYYNITSEHAPDSAFKIVKSALDYSGVNSYDSNITKIDKVLKYISAHVTYSTRLLDHMWFPSETLTFKSGDCTSFSILAASMLEASGVKCSIGFFRNSNGDGHAMVLIYLSDLGDLQYNYFEDLTAYSLKAGRWIIIEPQNSSVYNYSSDWISQWKLVAASEVKYGP